MTRNKLCSLMHLFVIVVASILLFSTIVYADLCGGGSSYDYWDYSDYGGVSLSKTADLMLNITDISGASFDEATGQIILYGKSPVSLPQMKLDDLAVAVRSVYGYGGKSPQDPGVSIGTEPSTIPGQMKVRFDGQTFNTGFGYTMFDADRLLKTLTIGKDNITGAPVTSSVSDYMSLPDRFRIAGSNSIPGDNFTTRFWFVPKDISLIQSTDNSSMLFNTATMKVLTESKFKNNVTADAVSEAFASHFTQYYDDFAAERPILNELKRLGKITAVVKWIKDNNIPFDLSFFDNYTPEYDNRTPNYTPSTTVNQTWLESGIINSLTVTGGVHYLLDASNFTCSQGTAADLTQNVALTARPNEGNFTWGFSSGGDSYQAVAHSMSRSRKDGNVKRTEIDMLFPVQGKNPLILFRYYNSFNDKSSGFGLGWETSPYKLRFPATKMSFTFDGQSVTVSAHYQIFVNEKGKEQLFTLIGLDALNNPVYAREGGNDFLKAENGVFVLYMKNQGTVTFDSDGKFTRITDSNGISINYTYAGNNLVGITHQDGRSITLNYTSGKVTSAVGPGGKTITYTYNATGDLETAKNEENEAVTYQYDSNRRLNNVIDARGNAVFQASFDDYNRATGQTFGNTANYTKNFNLAARMSTITDPNNVGYTQIFDADYRLLSMTDTTNRNLSVTYAGEFGPASITDSMNYITEYKYDNAGNISYIKDANGIIRLFGHNVENNLAIARDGRGYDTAYVYDLQNRLTEIRHVVLADVDTNGFLIGTYSYDPNNVTTFAYDPANGNLLSVSDPQGRVQQFTYDENGLPLTSVLQGGYTVTNTYDTRSRLETVTNAAGESIAYGYDNADRVTSITTSAGTVGSAYDKNGNISTAYDAKNNPTVYEYNINNKVTKVTDTENGITEYQYDATNSRLTQVTLPNGTIKDIEYDNLNRPTHENSQVPGVAPVPVVLQSAVSLGNTTAGVPSTQHVSVCNSGQEATSITNATTDNALFTITPTSAVLSPQQCIDLAVTFNGTAMGSQTGTLTITYGDGSTASVSLSADVAVSLKPTVISAPEGIDVSWQCYTDATRFSHYKVYRSTSDITTLDGLTPLTTINEIGITTYRDTSAVIGAKYYYSVVAFDSSSNMLTSVVSVGPINFLNLGKVGGPLTITPMANGGRSPAIAYNSNASYQSYLVVYEYDTSGSGTTWDIYGQRVTGDGQLIEGPFAIMNGGYNERNPRVAYNSTNNEYLVVAEYDSNGAGLYQVRAQRVSADGLLVDGVFTVFATTIPQYAPDIVYNSRDNENNYLVTFQSDHTGDGKDDILNLQLSNTGSLLVLSYQSYYGGSFRKPRIAYNFSANEYYLVFEYLDASNRLYIVGNGLNSAGSLLTNSIKIDNYTSYNGSYPDVVYNPAKNEYAVTWQYDSYGNGSSYSTWIRKVATDGTLGTYLNYSSSSYSLLWPVILHSVDNNEYVLAMTRQSTTSGDNDFIALRIDTSNLGLITSKSIGISTDSPQIERNASAAYNPTRAEFMAAFEYVNGTDLDVRTQRIGNVTENLSVSPASLDFGADASQLAVHVADTTGQNYLYLTNSTDRAWLSVSPGTINSPIPSADFTVTVSRNLLGVGNYTGNVLVISNGLETKIPVTVTVNNTPPTVPSAPLPQNGATAQFNVGYGLAANLGWDCTDANSGDTLSYEVYLSESQTLVNNSDPSIRIASGVVTKSATTPTLKYGNTYYWRITAKDSNGATTVGPVWSFTTLSIPRPTVMPYTPNITRNTSPTLAWNGISGIGKYRLQVANNLAFSPLLADYPNVTATSQTVGQSLPDGRIYWRVAGIDDGGVQGEYSVSSDFTVDTVSPTVLITSPVGLITQKPVLMYSTSDGVVKVKIDGKEVGKVSGNELDPLGNGVHSLRVEAVDAAGNLGFAETSFTLTSPLIYVSQSQDTFGSTFVNGPTSTVNFAVTNAGSSNLTINTATLTGTDASEFNVDATTCVDGKILVPADNCNLIVGLAPLSTGVKTASLIISSSDPYTPFKNITLNGSGAFPQLTVLTTGNGTGSVTSSPEGILCGAGGSTCAGTFPTGAEIVLSVVPEIRALFTGWSGPCTGIESICNITMNENMNVNASFETGNAARILSGLTLYGTLQDSFDAVSGEDTIQSRFMLTPEDLNLTSNVVINLKGGYDQDFVNVIGTTIVKGQLIISNGKLIVENLRIR